ncbi:MAG: Ig-like domain-containing protein [Bacteroidia bacterium]
MLRNVNVWKAVSVLILLLTGLLKPASAQGPTAGIDANDTIVCVGNVISFTDISVAGSTAITTWNWAFGDGGTSSSQNPSYAYTVGGNYTVQLIVTDANGNKDTATQAIYVLLAQAVNNTVRICSPQSTTTIIAVDPGIPGVSSAWFTASSGVIASPGNDTTLVSNLVSGTYLFFWVVTDGTCSDADQVTVIVDQPVTVNAGPDQQICSTPGTATMAASNPAPGTGQWSTTSTAIIANTANRNTAVSGMNTAGTYTFVWTVTNGSCVTRDTVNITVTTPVSSNAGSDQSVCTSPGTATLSGSNPTPGTGVWSTTSSATITTPASSGSGVTGLTSAGTYAFVWTITNGACVTRDTMNIVVTAPVTANAGSDIQVCTSTAQGTLTATNPSPGTGAWTAVSSGTIVSPASTSTLVTGLNTAGTYYFVWTVTNGPCVTRDTVAIVVTAPVTPNAGADQQICSSTTATLTGNSPSPGTGLWTTTGSATITTPASATTTVSNLAVGNNTFIWSITYGACVLRDTIVIRVDSAIAANAGPDQSICETTTTITLAGNNPAPGTGLWTKLNGGTITTPSSPTSTVTALTPGIHYFVWTITNGTCVRRDTMRVTVSVQIPSNAGLDQSICQGSTTSLAGNNPIPASGLWTTTSSATIVSPSSPSSALTGLTNAGVYTFVWTVTNGACVLRDTVRITVDSAIVATAGPDQNLCASTTATLAGNTPATGSGVWTTTGTASITTPSSATSGVTGLAYGNNTFVWTITNGSCVSRDTVVIRRDSVVTANAGTDQSVCASPGTTVMAATTPSAGSGLWTTTSSATIATPASPTTAVSGMSTAGTYTFVWTVTNGACVSRDTMVVTVSQLVNANAGSDQTLCNVTSATLAGSNPAPGTGTWTTTSSATITTPSSASSTITGLHAGTYTFVWTITNGACVSRDTVSVRVDSLITANAGPDQTVCSGAVIALAAVTPGTGTGAWTALNGGSISSATNPTAIVTGLTIAGNYNFVWTVTNGTCVSKDTVRITVDSLVTANAGSDQTLCNVTSATLAGSNPAPGTGLWSTASSAVITTPSSATSTVTSLHSGTYLFVWTVTNSTCVSRDTVSIRIDSLITSNAGPDQQVCSGSTVNMLANTPGLGSGTWTALNGGTISNASNPAATITGLSIAGTYNFVWTLTNGSCVSRDTIRITVDSLVVANAGSDQQLCGVTTTNLTANAATPGIGFWSTTSAAGITTLTDENSGVTGLSPGVYTFVWTITNGSCVSEDTVDVNVDSLESAIAGPDQTICSGSTLTMSATPASLGIGLWTALDGGTIANANDAATTVTDLITAGQYTFVWTIVNGTCISTDTVIITVDSLVIANAGSDQQLCGTTSTTMSANAATPGIGVWTTSSTASIANPADENSGVSGLNAGTYTLVWTITNGVCTSSDTVDIIIDSLEAAVAGPDQTICSGSTLTMAATPAVLGIGLWTAPDGGTIANANDPATTVTDLITAGNYTFIWTIVNGTCISSDTLVISVDSLVVADAGTDQQLCGTTTTSMAANAAAPGTGVWTTLSSAIIANAADELTGVSGLYSGNYTLVWTITNGTCVSSDSVEIISDSLETAIAGPDQTICSGSTLTMAANTPTLGVGFWSNPDGGTVNNTNDPNSTVDGLITAGNYTFIWTIVNGTCVSTDTLVITVDSLVTANAGGDQYLCETFGSTLSGNAVTLGAGVWTTSGSATIGLDTDPNSAVSNLTYGTNDFIWTITNGTCISSDTVTLTVDSLIAANAGADQQVCAGTDVTLQANAPASGTGQWDAPDGGVIANLNDDSVTVTGLVNAGTYQFIWTISNGACLSSDTLIVVVDSLVPAIAGPDQNLCESTDSTYMAAVAPVFGTGTWTTASTAVIANINDPVTLVSGLTPGTYDFVWTVVNNTCTSTDTISIVVSPLATPANAGTDQAACENTPVTISGNTPLVGTGSWSSLGTAVVDTPGVEVSTVSGLSVGVNSFVYTITSGACISTDTMDVIIFPLPVADAGADQYVTSGTLVTLGGSPAASGGTGTYTYAWSPAAGLNDTTLANPDVTVSVTSTFVLLVTDSMGCTATDTITIWVNNPPDAQNDTIATSEDTAVAIYVLLNDTDPDNNLDTTLITVTAGPFNGTVVVGPGGLITYTPNPNYYGPDSLFYTVCDSGIPVYCDSAWVFFNILPVNDPPLAVDDTASTVEDSCIQIAVLANDTDVENMINVLSLVTLNGPFHGTITLDTLTGIITYCPDTNFVGTDTLVYMICDSGYPAPGLCDTAMVVITVNSLNDPPVVLSDSAYSCSGDAVYIPVLANDYDPEGDTLTVSILTNPVNGSAVITATQEIIYSSNPGTSGWDSLQYVACDQQSPAGCDTTWMYIYVHPLPQITAAVTDVLCANDSTGVIDITMNPSGTYFFTWNNGSSDEDIDSLPAGIYNVTVVDSNGCIVFYEDTVNAPAAPLSAFLITQDVKCYGDSSGSIDLQMSGGTIPYTFSWDNGSTDEDIDSLFAGTYNVLVTDSNGCTLQSAATINAPSAPLAISLTVTDVLCGGDSTGAIIASVTGGTPSYTGVWSNGATDSMIVLIPAGIYTVTVTDSNGCVISATDTVIDVNAPLIPNATVVQPHCLSNTLGFIALAATGGVQPFGYTWSNGDTTALNDTLPAGIYNLTLTDANGCSFDSSFVLSDTSDIRISITGNTTFCDGDSVILQADNYPGVSYQWLLNGAALPSDTTSQLVVYGSGDYEMQAISGCGNYNDGPVTITNNPLPVIDAGTDHTIECDSLLTLTATGALTYSWTPALLCIPPDQDITVVSPDVTTTFIVVGTDGNGCSATDTVLVTVTCDTLFVPSGISPNGDNINDYFVINQIDKYPNANLKIFNRWGSLVYEKDNYDNTWNGFSNSDLIRVGKELPDGTYFWVLDLKDGNSPLNGYVVLRR